VRGRWLLAVDIGVKLALVGLLIFAVARPDLPQFSGKAMTARAIAYPLALIVVPVAWWFVRRSRPVPYPYVLDMLVGLPSLIDTAGNALNLYDTIGWWDDANHFVNWAILVAGFGQLLVRLALGLAGSVLAATVTVTVLWRGGSSRGRRARPAPARAPADPSRAPGR
jgi:hypothetical protein